MGMNNFVEVIGDYDKAQKRRWPFIVFTIVVFSIAGIYLLTVIVERYSTTRFPSIEQLAVTAENTPSEAQSLASPSEESPVASPTTETMQATASLNPIFVQATEHALSIQAATGDGR
jgi:hypothetical protein